MDNSFVEHYKMERMGKPLDEYLKQNEEYQKRKKQYRDLYDEIEKCLDDGAKASSLLAELDEAVGDYSASYGDAAYFFGFHDGMEMGLEHKKYTLEETKPKNKQGITLEDMVNLIHIHDAYKSLNTCLHGENMELTYDEGTLGEMGRIYEIISRHTSPKFQENDVYEGEIILADTSLAPEERARLLMMKE